MHYSLQIFWLAFFVACNTPLPDENQRPRLPETVTTAPPVSIHQDIPEQQSNIRINYGYQFDAPDATLKLPKVLREISGLTLFDEKHLAVVQDEKGRVFKISLESGAIIEEERFEKDGDYEGIERVDDIFYVLKSNGDLFETGTWPLKSKETIRYKTTLSARCDAEGLTHDVQNQRLLIACKEHPGAGLSNVRAIYAFDLETKKLFERPVYTVSLDALAAQSSENALNRAIRKLAAPVTDLNRFKPAAIALHPQTGHLFVISSVQKLLIALTQDNQIDAAWTLPEKLFPQPEGLVFLPNGDLYISNEGGGGNATLLKFSHH